MNRRKQRELERNLFSFPDVQWDAVGKFGSFLCGDALRGNLNRRKQRKRRKILSTFPVCVLCYLLLNFDFIF